MRLYELSAEIHNAIELYNHVESDEDLKTLEDKLNALQTPFNDKCIAVAKHVLNIEADQTAIESEIKRLQLAKKRAEGEAEWARGYLFRNMLAAGSLEVDGTLLKVKIQKNPPAVIVEDETQIPEEYKRVKTVIEIDRVAIKDAWKNGVGVAGTKVEQGQRLTIK